VTGRTVEELESLARVLEREAEARVPATKSPPEGVAGQCAAADGGGQRSPRRSSRPGSPRRRRA
jgi:hypothetical protein